jgi:hypothetical protein
MLNDSAFGYSISPLEILTLSLRQLTQLDRPPNYESDMTFSKNSLLKIFINPIYLNKKIVIPRPPLNLGGFSLSNSE